MSANISVIITTYGRREWHELAMSRAYPSAAFQEGMYEVHVEHFDDLEIGPARNEARKRATGDWLLFLDADDELEPRFIHHMQRVISSHGGREILLTPAVSYVRNGRAAPARFNREGDLRDDNWLVVGTVISAAMFDQVKGFSDYPHGFEDWSLWAKAVHHGGAQVMKVPKAVYVAYVNPKSKHRTGWRDRRWQVDTHIRVRQELFPELYA